MKKIITGFLLIASLAFTTCEVALGTRINFICPIITITGPSADRSAGSKEIDPLIGEFSNLEGSVRTPAAVALLTVTLDYYNKEMRQIVRMGREWKWENGWYTRESSRYQWRAYNPQGASWNISREIIYFNLPIFMTRMESGDYFITISAWDTAGLHDSNSIAKLKVKYSNVAPKFVITNPVDKIFFGDSSSLSEPELPNYSKIIFDPFNKPLDTYNNLKFLTNNFDGKLYLKEDNSLKWRIETGSGNFAQESLEILFTNKHNLDNITGREYYFKWDNSSYAGSLPEYGMHGATDGTYTSVGSEVTLTQDAYDYLPEDTITPMMIVSTVKDTEQNEEYKYNGWLLYLPDSDRPFVDIQFGYKVFKEDIKSGNIPNDAAERNSMPLIYRGNEIRNRFYDDDGVSKVVYTVHLLKPGELGIEKSFDPVTVTCNNSGEGTWNFYADPSYGIGRFRIDVVAYDIYNVDGYTYYSYFTINSNERPTMRVLPFEGDSDTTWGNTNGTFNISGIAQIECNDSCNSQTSTGHSMAVTDVLIVWMTPNPKSGTVTDNSFRYSDPTDPLWDFTSDGEDQYGNKRWLVPKGDITWQQGFASPPASNPSQTGNLNGNSQEDWKFELKNLNWFATGNNGFNVGHGTGKIPFDGFDFKVKLISKKDTPNATPSHSVTPFNTNGETDGPVMAITHIDIDDGVQQQLIPLGSLSIYPRINRGTKVRFRGTWQDTSINSWSGVSNRETALTRNFAVSWIISSSKSIPFPLPLNPLVLSTPVGGTWSTAWYEFTEANVDAIVTIAASLTDISNNQGIVENPITIETDTPTLTRISSTLNDGRYGSFKDTYLTVTDSRYIDIFLDFNKPIEFFKPDVAAEVPTLSNAPYLILNNGGRAYFVGGIQGGNQSNRITFRYFINGTNNSGTPGYTALAPANPQAGSSTNKNSNDRLNVTRIEFNGYPPEKWVSVSQTSTGYQQPVIITPNFLLPAGIAENDPYSLFEQKKIVIDKVPPFVTAVSTTTSNTRPHGIGSQVRINVKFSEEIRVSGNTDNLYLTLNSLGGAANTNRAYYESTGYDSVTFLYTVEDGHNTTDSIQFGVASLSGNTLIRDIAGNPLQQDENVTTDSSNTININSNLSIRVDTTKPPAPSVINVSANKTYYGDVNYFNISGLETGYLPTVEYCIDTTASPQEWLTYSWPSGATNNGQTGNINLPINGTYNIAARQKDNATTPNVSPDSATIVNVSINKGELLERFTSSNPDGIYGAGVAGKSFIDIDVEFRIPLNYDTSGTAPTLTVGPVGTSIASTAALRSAGDGGSGVGTKKWTFRYTIPAGATTGSSKLDVTGFNFNDAAVTINDVPSGGGSATKVNGTGGWINMPASTSANRFNKQKDIEILTGNPALNSTPPSDQLTPTTTVSDMYLYESGTTLELRLQFNRDIYRGNTAEKLIIRQVAGTHSATHSDNTVFRIPAVMTSDKYNAIFTARNDIFTDHSGIMPTAGIWAAGTDTTGSARATLWQDLGKYLYEQGSNGATESGGRLKADTTTKYVLRYFVGTTVVDTAINSLSISFESSGTKTTSMDEIRAVFRAAEALSFGVNDPEVEITNTGNPSRPQRLDISISKRGGLPVPGATYELIIPNGFVKDILGKPNGGAGTGSDAAPDGSDSNLSSNSTGTTRGISYTGTGKVEAPVIRVNKGDDEHPGYIGSAASTDTYRNIGQKLDTTFRVDCRTPGSSITFTTKQTTDNVYTLANRNGITGMVFSDSNTDNTKSRYLRLPNLGTQTENTAGWTSFENTRLRPQSGGGTQTTSPVTGASWTATGTNDTTTALGLHYFAAMATAWGADTITTTIGNDNYNSGGMEINIRARAYTGTSTSPVNSEYAYEAAYRSVLVFNNQPSLNNADPISLGTDKSTRMFVRGGNTTQGDPTIPDFPISRDPTKWKKVKLMSPIRASAFSSATASVTNSSNVIIDDNLSEGQRVWVWVTWRLNVPAFVDLHSGDLYTTGTLYNDYPAPRANIRQVYQGWVPQKEHYAVHPGRTTIVESRNTGNQWDGGHGGVMFTEAEPPKDPTDLN